MQRLAHLLSAIGQASVTQAFREKDAVSRLHLQTHDPRLNIRVNAVGPTYIETAMTAPNFADPVFHKDALSRIPLGRIGQLDEIMGAIVFLASPASGLITGASLTIDGGWTAQ